MLTGTRRSETFDYISEMDDADSEEKGATVFELTGLTVDARTRLQDGMMRIDPSMTGAFTMNNNQQHLAAIRECLTGLRNMRDQHGELIEFKTETKFISGQDREVVADSVLATFPSALITELGRVLMAANSVSAAERKKSNTQS